MLSSGKIRAGLVPALLLIFSTLASAGSGHGLNIPAGLELPERLEGAIQAQHDHDFDRARSLLAAYLKEHPADAQAALVNASIEAATGHWAAAQAACAPLITQMPAWMVAACLGQSARGLDSVRANLALIRQRPDEADPQLSAWAESVAEELEHRLQHAQDMPKAAHPQH